MIVQYSVANRQISIRIVCRWFQISETCYRYESKLNTENEYIARLLIKLANDENSSDWGFGMCFSHLLNVEGYQWNHKRLYPIYCELALNLLIRPKRRLNRNTAETPEEPIKLNQVWSVDFTLDQLSGCRKYRLFNVIDDYKREGQLAEPDFPFLLNVSRGSLTN